MMTSFSELVEVMNLKTEIEAVTNDSNKPGRITYEKLMSLYDRHNELAAKITAAKQAAFANVEI